MTCILQSQVEIEIVHIHACFQHVSCCMELGPDWGTLSFMRLKNNIRRSADMRKGWQGGVLVPSVPVDYSLSLLGLRYSSGAEAGWESEGGLDDLKVSIIESTRTRALANNYNMCC
jgi:hypothetical protein